MLQKKVTLQSQMAPYSHVQRPLEQLPRVRMAADLGVYREGGQHVSQGEGVEDGVLVVLLRRAALGERRAGNGHGGMGMGAWACLYVPCGACAEKGT